MLTLFILKKSGCTDVVMRAEGDDGIFRFIGKIDQSVIDRLDVKIKLAVTTDISKASFCGLVFDPSSQRVVCDPKRVLLNFGWLDRKLSGSSVSTRKSYLRAKALSLLNQYPGCPVVQSLALYGLRVTRSIKTASLNSGIFGFWERETLTTVFSNERKWRSWAREVRDCDRQLVDRVFGLCVDEQKKIESYLDSLGELQPLEIDLKNFSEVTQNYWNNYVDEVLRTDNAFHPDTLHPKIFGVEGFVVWKVPAAP
jgi:hypothetical protein